jgi:hypothetical protein
MGFLRRVTLLLSLCGMTLAATKPEVQVLEVRAQRVESEKIAVDGSVKNTSGKLMKGLIVIFDFLSSENATLTSQRIQMADDVLTKGQASSFHAETLNPPGAVRYRLRAFDNVDHELRIGNAGPFPIE